MTVERAVQAHRAAMVAAVLGVVGNAISLPAYWSLGAPPLRYAQFLGMAVSAGALVVLWLRRARPSVALGDTLFLLVLLPTVVMLWTVDQERAASGARWVPYEANKLSALTLAVIAPPGWRIGVAAILLFVGSALAHHAVMPDLVQAHMVTGEPFGIIAYGTFALVVLAFRQRGRALEAELARARVEKLALERMARVALSLRDLANTPMQTLELVRHELPELGARPAVLGGRMRRALEHLGRMNHLLSRYAGAVHWDDDALSLDAEAEAEALLGERTKPG